jgi:hypothetical protein
MSAPAPHLFREQPFPGGTSAALTPGQLVVVTSPLRPQGYPVTVPASGVANVGQLLSFLGLSPGTSVVKNLDFIDRRDNYTDGGGSFET